MKQQLNKTPTTEPSKSRMKTYSKEAVLARFLLGGIGTGNISVGARGEFTDFEISNSPQKGFRSPYTFFAIRTKGESGETMVKALEAQVQPPYNHSHGFNAWEIGGLPRFQNSQMASEYPFVSVMLTDSSMPVEAKLEAFTPFIPLNADDSSLPCAIIRYSVHNISDEVQEVSVAGSFANLCNYTHNDIWTKPLFEGTSVNTYVENELYRGINFSTESKTEQDITYMDMAFVTLEQNAFYREYWNEGGWWDGLQDFWNDFSEDGLLDKHRELKGDGNHMHKSDITMASLGSKKTILPNMTETFEFILTWYHPNRIRSWDQLQDPSKTGAALIKNYYAKFGDALSVAQYVAKDLPRLERTSRDFSRAMYSGSYPPEVIEAVATNITVIRSNTCFRVEDGTFFAYEGCFDNAGCCDGNCTHVWNYAQTLAFLFPELERSMRRTEFIDETDETGKMTFRARTYLGDPPWEFPAAADGQMGCIIRLYRDWKISGDEEFLQELWPEAKKALEYAFVCWDADKDGMLDSQQHNTYDIEFYGPNSMINSIYLAALKAGSAISHHLGDEQTAARYDKIAESAAKLLDDSTFNGEYYIQNIGDINAYKYQYGTGCLSDQVFGQQLAHINGLGYVLNKEHIQKAVQSIYRYNFKPNMQDHCNLQRTYALNDEPGLLLCTWPKGGRPEIPFVYSDEVWTGVEYQVAAHLIYEGFVDEGLNLVKAVRSRQDGIRRSPWNEVECGHHYARSLASYGVMLALSGFSCDLPNHKLYFHPTVSQDDFSTFFCCGTAWGIFHRKKNPADGRAECTAEVLYGSLEGIEIICE